MNSNSVNEKKIKNWKKSVENSGCTIRSLEAIKEIRKKDGSLLFALLETDVISPEGNKLPHVLFIRGDACVIVTLIKNSDTGEEKFLMVGQRRIGNGFMSLEFPAGMLDEEDDPVEVAIQELYEETGLRVSRSDIYPLNDKKLYSSAGASDEGIYYYGCIKKMDEKTYHSFANKKTGSVHENEFITTVLKTRTEAEKESSSLQVRLGFYLFENSRNSG
ncbi:NUDIX hydrolase [Chitinispirillales bacterium ANBcel5]|uniref:NUDIX hydrolase n=1 Tax=Cellulosispirillum alkaliphilum TaxID=3039283 RepID=UPI002A51E915|nr:NUDIX hydrolase [Chitinispirillales bacterium ANBcel5]